MKHVIIGTAGHIDHGKSSLVLALTGTDPDRLQEEKARGITIDLGFAHTVEDGIALSFVDVPGHERFVRNMLAGVGGMDLVMLHVAADESVMPQTREHFDICRLLAVPSGLVVITKSDLVDAATLDVVRLEVQDLVAGSFLEDRPIHAVSARTGAGLADLRRTLASLARAAHARPSAGPPRLPIDRVFSMKGFGTVVTGTLIGGRLAIDEEIVCQPSGRIAKVRGLQVHGERRDEAIAGQRVAVNLAGVELADVARGDTLTHPDAVTVTRVADIRVGLLPSARAAAPWRTRSLPPGNSRAAGPRRPDGTIRRAAWGIGVRPYSSRGAGSARPRRSIHPSRLLSAHDDRRRRGAGSAAASPRGPHAGRRRPLRADLPKEKPRRPSPWP